MKALTEAGIVEHVQLPAPASVAAYALTERGEALEADDGRAGGLGLRPRRARGAGRRGLDVEAVMAREHAGGVGLPGSLGDRVVNFDIEGDRFVVRSDGDGLRVRHGAAEDPDGELSTDMRSFFEMTQGDGSPEDPVAAEVLEALAGR